MVAQGLGRGEGGESQKGLQPTWGLVCVERGSLRGEVFEGLLRGMRGDASVCRGHHTREHPYMF